MLKRPNNQQDEKRDSAEHIYMCVSMYIVK